MSRPAKIFVAFGLDEYSVDDDGNPTPVGMSNKAVGRWFCDQLRDIGGDRVEVVVIEDPPTHRISEQVKRSIDEADAVICVFAKRVLCQIERKWTTSQYVVSESGYAAARFRSDVDHRLFGFVEQGVDSERLGVAFPRDRTVHSFRRLQLDSIRPKLEQIVSTLVGVRSEQDVVEHMRLEKTVTIRTDGRAEIEARHKFRVRRKVTGFQMQHTLWRVRDTLPPFAKLLAGVPGKSEHYLKCILIQIGKGNPDEVTLQLNAAERAENKKAILFSISIPRQTLEAGDVVEYSFAWSYPDAFLATEALERWEMNSAGLRAGTAGPIGQVILRLMFERNWIDNNVFPCIELPNDATGPQVWTSSETTLPTAVDPRDFWHRNGRWSSPDVMQRIRDAQRPLFEVYEWQARNFAGLVKASWQPMPNYHQPRIDQPNARNRLGDAENNTETI